MKKQRLELTAPVGAVFDAVAHPEAMNGTATHHAALFDGPGEMRARCRAFDWSTTPLGPVAEWPLSLRTTVATMLASRHPMFLFWGPDLVQLYNDSFSPSLGAGEQRGRALGRRGDEYWTEIWHIIGPQIALIMAGGESTWHEDQMVPIQRNGRMEEVYWTYSYSPAFDDRGGVGGVLVVCQETTRRVSGEREHARLHDALVAERARLTEMFRGAPTFIAMLRGPDLKFEFVNDAYRKLVGHRDVIGKPLFDALPELRGQGFQAILENVRDTGEPWIGRETPVMLQHTPGGAPEMRYLDMVFQGLSDVHGGQSGMVGHGTDVTAHVMARRQIEVLLAQSESARAAAVAAQLSADVANRAKSEFLANMSHELRTPLTAIGGYAELIALGIHGPVTEEQRAALARLLRSQRHLVGLISGVLDFAKLNAGAMQYASQDVPLGDLIATCEALTAPQRHAKQQKIRVDGDGQQLTAWADREKLQQVMLNLLSNAVKFTAPGGQITITCEHRADGPVVIRVRDTGCGIAAGEFEHVFQPFVQLDSKLTRASEGTGLGLAISRDLMRGMGGDLTLESEVGVGSTFTLTLPRTRPK